MISKILHRGNIGKTIIMSVTNAQKYACTFL